MSLSLWDKFIELVRDMQSIVLIDVNENEVLYKIGREQLDSLRDFGYFKLINISLGYIILQHKTHGKQESGNMEVKLADFRTQVYNEKNGRKRIEFNVVVFFENDPLISLLPRDIITDLIRNATNKENYISDIIQDILYLSRKPFYPREFVGYTLAETVYVEKNNISTKTNYEIYSLDYLSYSFKTNLLNLVRTSNYQFASTDILFVFNVMKNNIDKLDKAIRQLCEDNLRLLILKIAHLISREFKSREKNKKVD